MKEWQKALIGPGTSLRGALETINGLGCQIVLIVDSNRRLLGTLSDGDARRALLGGLSMSDTVTAAMHGNPKTVSASESRHVRLALMRRYGLHQLPLLDADGCVIGLETVDDYLNAPSRDEWIVIMAGGLGSRLRELTQDKPKPMLNVGSRPLLETIVQSCAAQGFRRIFLAVNYKSEQIEAHFGDGSQYGVEISYLREHQRMGTAGALGLLPKLPDHPIVVTNADLLTKEDFTVMCDRHIESGAHATMATREFEMQVPFGVVREINGRIQSIEEKPLQRFMVSAGMYVLSPDVLRFVPSETFFDMPTLFEILIKEGMMVRSHHVNGYWLDIGRLADYERANVDFYEKFQ